MLATSSALSTRLPGSPAWLRATAKAWATMSTTRQLGLHFMVATFRRALAWDMMGFAYCPHFPRVLLLWTLSQCQRRNNY
jgi:hypothetical protein